MFFHNKLVTDEDLSSAWRAGHNIPVSTPTDEAKVYRTSRIVNKLVDKGGLLSLRTASVLTSGVVRMHQENADTLLEDCERLVRCIETRRTSNEEHLQEDGHESSKSDEDNISITYTRASQFSRLNHQRPTSVKHTGADPRRTSSKSSSPRISSGDESTPPKKRKSNASKSIEEVPRHSQPETSQENVSQSIGSNDETSRKRTSTSSKNGTTPGSKSTGSYSKITEKISNEGSNNNNSKRNSDASAMSDGALQKAESPDVHSNCGRRRISNDDSSLTSRSEGVHQERSSSHEGNSASENESNISDSSNPDASCIEEDQPQFRIQPEWRPKLSTINEISENVSPENTSTPFPYSELNTTREKDKSMLCEPEAEQENISRKTYVTETMEERESRTPSQAEEVRDKERTLPSGHSITPPHSNSSRSEDYDLPTLELKENQNGVSPNSEILQERESSIFSEAREEQNRETRDPETEADRKIVEDFELEAVRKRDIRAFPEGSPLLPAPVRTGSKDNDVQPELEEIRMSHHSNAEQNSEEPQAVIEPEAVSENDDGLSSHSSIILPCSAREKHAKRPRKEMKDKKTGSSPTKGSPQSAATLPYVINYYYCCDSMVPCAISHQKINI